MTIFLAGFPDNFSERELHNLFRLCPGFVTSRLNMPPGKAKMGFVLFETNEYAASAKDKLNGVALDPQTPQIKLAVLWAKRELDKEKDARVAAPLSHAPSGGYAAPTHLPSFNSPYSHPSAYEQSQYSIRQISPQQHFGGSFGGPQGFNSSPELGYGGIYPGISSVSSYSSGGGVPFDSSSRKRKTIPTSPIDTIYISGIAINQGNADAVAQELQSLIEAQAGLVKLSLKPKGEYLLGFAQFVDVPSASLAQGSLVSDSGFPCFSKIIPNGAGDLVLRVKSYIVAYCCALQHRCHRWTTPPELTTIHANLRVR